MSLLGVVLKLIKKIRGVNQIELEDGDEERRLREKERLKEEAIKQKQKEWNEASPEERSKILERRREEVLSRAKTRQEEMDGWVKKAASFLRQHPGAYYTLKEFADALGASGEEDEFYRGKLLSFHNGENVTYLSDGNVCQTGLYYSLRKEDGFHVIKMEGVTYIRYCPPDN